MTDNIHSFLKEIWQEIHVNNGKRDSLKLSQNENSFFFPESKI